MCSQIESAGRRRIIMYAYGPNLSSPFTPLTSSPTYTYRTYYIVYHGITYLHIKHRNISMRRQISFNRGARFSCVCALFLIKGKPRPTLSWYRDGTLIESVTKDDEVSGGQVKQSAIILGPLRRSDLLSTLTCRAINHPNASPMEATVQIDMNCKYLSPPFIYYLPICEYMCV